MLRETSKKSDLNKARALVDEAGSFLVGVKAMRPKITEVVAGGIAFGRRDGLEMAAKALEAELPALAARIRALDNSK
jgi:hypothetical protein